MPGTGREKTPFCDEATHCPIEIAAIKKHEGFEWIQRKHFLVPSLTRDWTGPSWLRGLGSGPAEPGRSGQVACRRGRNAPNPLPLLVDLSYAQLR
jgi:hypothetical protein